MKNLIRYLRLYVCIFERSLINLMINRFNFVIWSVVHLFELAINILFFQVIYLRTAAIGGWSIYETLILLGYMEFILGFGGITFYPMMYGFSKMVQKGELDWKLVKPVDIQFLATFPWLDQSDMLSMVTGTGLMLYGFSSLHQPIFPNVLIFVMLFFPSMIILYSIVVLLVSTTFKTSKFESVETLFWSFQWLGKYPATVFKGGTYLIFMYIIPIGIVSSVPARALAGSFDLPNILYSLVFAGILFILARKIFLSNIRHYSSASS